MESKTRHLRIIDDDKIDELYDRILELVYSYDVTVYEAIGVLDCVKTDILLGEGDDD